MKVDLISSAGLLEAAEIALLAERTGFSSLLFPESRRTPFLSVAAAGAVTERIGLGTAVSVAFSRSPMVTAQLAWELAEATRGRFQLGLGTQVRAHV
ncbi:MAG: LLM class flavin-dependent oxidoreductase, partial [Ilumatobacteraceae bacterium]